MTAASPARRAALAAVLFLAGSAVFAAAYGLAPLYYSNQNQYFLHGLAAAGHGQLAEDWLANTADPTPAFSALVALTARYLHPWAFHVYHALLLGVYAAAMLGLFFALAGEKAEGRWPVFLALVVAAHSGLARWLSYRLVGFDYPWFLQAGVAGQYVLGSMLQPSAFGVLLVAAVALFARGRPYLAAAAVGLTGNLHSTYLLPGALLTLGFLTALLLERRWRVALGAGALALVLVLPAVAYGVIQFRPTSAETFAEAQDVLVNLRIPHHSRPDVWLGPVAGVQIAWVALALALVWRTPLFPALGVPAALSALLTALQAVTDSQALALLFPWRVSAVLVPVAATIILSRLVAALPAAGERARVASFAAVAVLAGAGVWIMATRQAFLGDDGELPLMEHAWRERASGQVWFLPVRLQPPPKPASGSLSSDFLPLEEKKASGKVIPVDLQRFRLHGGVPIFVDFKSIPYKDTEVLLWRNRLLLAQAVQEDLKAGQWSQARAELRRLGVTHLVLAAGGPAPGEGAKKVYEDQRYLVYRLAEAGGK